MRKTIYLLALSTALLLPSTLSAVTYYVSPTGSDTNTGTSSTAPWKTITRVNQIGTALNPGDQILFQRGGVYRGKVTIPDNGVAGNPMVLGAYGTGAAPIISGSVAVTGWTVHSGNIWKAPVSSKVKYVYLNGAMQTLARYPNTGWLRTDVAASTSIVDAALTQGSGYFTGARAVIRTTNWSYDTARVSAHTGTTLTHTSTGNSMGAQQWGYFLCNKLSLLDTPGEWYWEAGQLYVWCPNNANPSSLLVEAAVQDFGVYFGWQRNNWRVENIAMQHQIEASLRLSGTYNLEVAYCTISDTYQAIMSTGNDESFHHLTIARTYGTGVYLQDSNSSFTFSTLDDIALIPGLGENNWGYFGIRSVGSNMTYADNRLTNIGYIGMVVEQNTLVERNVVREALATLNDGGGIAIDNADGLIIRKNVVMDMVGNIESIAPEHTSNFPICHGIYFGNISIKNTTVDGNTVANCASSGIHVDHTMTSSGNQVKNNVLYNNGSQLSISDFSNYNGVGAVAPFHVPVFNTIYSGNTMYCLTRDQFCMSQLHVYSNNFVDYGTFSNNYFYNPYNELSIEQFNTFAGIRKYYSLERWQVDRGEDAGSSRSPLRQNDYATASELSSDLVVNGTFNSNVTGWGGWPTNATSTHNTSFLDNGCLKANLPNNSVYNEFSVQNPNTFQVTNGQWYRIKFSVQAPANGQFEAGSKGASQQQNQGVVAERAFAIGPERRDLEYYFQSALTDQAYVRFVNQYTEPTYYLDNVSVHRVTVTPVNPLLDHVLLVNDQATAQNYSLTGTWKDVTGTVQGTTVSLQPYTSKVVYRTSATGGTGGSGTVGGKLFLAGPMNWTTGIMATSLKTAGLVPQTEPYTALGITVANSGATVASSVWNATGNQTVVDWVVLELRNADATYTVAERRAAILRADGTVVDAASGNTQVSFGTTTVGKYLVVRHRNHLPAMTSSAISQVNQVMDFSLPAVSLYGTNGMQTNGTYRALWPGDVTRNHVVSYAGSNNDRDPMLVAVGSTVPTNTITGYRVEDVNLDGTVKYVGSANDRDVILVTIGGTVPTATKAAQVP
ncbi:MAG: right-handed parallel beta-helix repeat-containing protein [Flavobacteriales bacterium]|nr:right-handed parallel beta-helix repeat-containing protein [Flavobacteriales bacterium]